MLTFRPIAPTSGAAQSLHYDVVGDGAERFLIKRITQRPDFDHIVSLRTASRGNTKTHTLIADALNSPSLTSLVDALCDQAGLIATDLLTIYDDRADLQ